MAFTQRSQRQDHISQTGDVVSILVACSKRLQS